ncbi:hypothetical protein, partial [Lactobacillus helveticus]
RSVQRKRTKQPFNDCLILFIYSLSTGFDKEPKKTVDFTFDRFYTRLRAINYSKNQNLLCCNAT